MSCVSCYRGKPNRIRCFAVAIAAACCVCASDSAVALTVWIDTDPAIDAPWRETDDAFALIHAFHSPNLKIAGVSTSYGNASLATTSRVATDLVKRFSAAPLSVFKGANAASDIGRPTAAADALAAALKTEPRLTYVALAPLTNLATFHALHPELFDHIDRIVFVGGESSAEALRFGAGGWLKIHDANVVKDRAAMKQVLATAVPMILAPAENGAQVTIDREQMQRIAARGPAGAFLAGNTRAWLWFWTIALQHRGGALFDLFGMLALTNPDAVRTCGAFARCDERLIYSAQRQPGSRPVTVCTAFSGDVAQLAW